MCRLQKKHVWWGQMQQLCRAQYCLLRKFGMVIKGHEIEQDVLDVSHM
jgi:hypothetical protein